jgi:hypothetical protein
MPSPQQNVRNAKNIDGVIGKLKPRLDMKITKALAHALYFLRDAKDKWAFERGD